MRNDYSDVPLTEEEAMEALRVGREKKFFEIQREAYYQKMVANQQWNIPNARQLFEFLRNTRGASGKLYQVTEWNKDVIFSLCLYFAGDEKFNTRGEGFSLDKGIFLTGVPGVGKTHLMNFFQKNPHASYANVTCKTIAEHYRTGWKRNDTEALEWYSSPLKAPVGHIYDQKELGYCFGDLGTEEEKKNFGNTMNVMEHIIFERYEKKIPFNLTHFTTNLNASEVETAYGLRIRDRLKEMCNQLALIGPSFR